ncbi:MAG: AAA family ATPase [Legionella sp.]|nr:AAA family ATPase [Legionella sp.]
MDNNNLTDVNPNSLVVDALFKPANWLVKITFINHLVLINNILITVFAPAHGGKTSFIKLLLQGLDNNIYAKVLTALPTFSSTSFLAQLCAMFTIEPDSSTTITSVIEQINQRKKHCLVIVDDAQHLPLEFLRAILLELNNYGSQNFFHLCLVSDFSLAENLNQLKASLFADRIHTLELDGLTESETKTYLLKNLYLTKGLNKTKLKQFYQLTGGNMSSINAHMNSFFKDERFDIPKTKSSPIKWLGVAASVLLVSAASAFFLQNYKFVDTTTSIAKLEAPKLQKSLVSEIPALNVASVRESITMSAELVNKDNIAEGRKIQAVRQCIVAISEALSDKPAIPASTLVAIGPLITKPAQSILPARTRESYHLSRRVNRQERAPLRKGRFTIQLLASRSQTVIKKFQATHGVSQRAKISISKRQGINWYVLTLGEFKHKNEAKAATNHLPVSLARLNPWIRPVEGLKAVG